MKPWDNIVDLLHGMDINICDKLCKFSFMDRVVLDTHKDKRAALDAFFVHIDCSIDLKPKAERDANKKWYR